MERGESIIVRQVVQVTVNGQVRTLEISLPIPVNATREEIEQLLDTADTGMELLSTYLEDKVNELIELEEGVALDTESERPAPTAPTLRQSFSRVVNRLSSSTPSGSGRNPVLPSASVPAPLAPAAPVNRESGPPPVAPGSGATGASPAAPQGPGTTKPISPAPPTPRMPAATGQGDSEKLHVLAQAGEEETDEGEDASREESGPRPGLLSKLGGGVEAARAMFSNRRDSAPSGPAAQPHPPSTPVATPGGSSSAKPEMGLKQFLAEAKDMGFSPPQVLQILGRKTLTGIDFKESLRVLREHARTRETRPSQPPAPRPGQPGVSSAPGSRVEGSQLARPGTSGQPSTLRASAPSSPAPKSNPPPQTSPPPQSRSPLPSNTIRERGDLSGFLGLDEDPDEDEQDELDRLVDEHLKDAEDGEDHEDESAGEADEEEVRVTRQSWESSAPPEIAGYTPAGGKASVAQLAKAGFVLEKLRANRGGIKPQPSQLYSFRNIVQEELGLEKTRALLQAVWKLSTPEQLTSTQISAITEWGKSETFADEVEVILDSVSKG